MGRKKLNRTKEELDELNRTRRMRYYWKHRTKERQSALNRYYKRKKNYQEYTK
jgi:hypothetical protein